MATTRERRKTRFQGDAASKSPSDKARKKALASEVDGGEAQPSRRDYSSFGWAMLAGILIWASLPPLWFWPLAMAAMLPLMVLIQRPQLGGRRPYRQIWVASFLQTLLLLQFVRLSHPAAYLGWLVLSAYLSLYLPLIVAGSRYLVHRGGWPAWLALPLMWLTMDWIKGHLLTGFSVALLGHSLARVPVAIQIADLIGDYGVSALVVLWGATIAGCLGVTRGVQASRRSRVAAAAVLVTSLAGVLLYGNWRLGTPPDATERDVQVAIVQGSVDTVFPSNEEEGTAYWQAIDQQYRDGTQSVLAQAGELDLILWPESKFTQLDVLPPDGWEASAEELAMLVRAQVSLEAFALIAQGQITSEQLRDWVRARDPSRPLTLEEFRAWKDQVTQRFVPMLVGSQSRDFEGGAVYNAAIYLDDRSQVADRYFKNHLVMFGEYIPGAQFIPWLYQLGPVAAGLTPGERATSVSVEGLRFAPSICFETTVPRVIRRLVRELQAEGEEPDVLVNLTDDGWFWGSSALDFHLACNIFRAVEMRKPMLVAANTGLSAHITGRGVIAQMGPRRETQNLLVNVRPESLESPYLIWGDWPIRIVVLGVALSLLLIRVRQTKPTDARESEPTAEDLKPM